MNETTGEEVAFSETVGGVAVGTGRLVLLEDDDLPAAAPGAMGTIELLNFVGGEEADPLYYTSSCDLASESEVARRPCALFATAFAKSNRVGIATFVLREREHLCVVGSRGSLLILEAMHLADELRAALEGLVGLDEVEQRPRELDMALSLVDSMAGLFDLGRYSDACRERIDELVAAKERGEEAVIEIGPALHDAAVIDLVSAQSRSVGRARERRGAARAASEGPAGNGDDLGSQPRPEFAERAQAAGVPGRSTMSPDELVPALGTIEHAARGSGRGRAS